MNKKHSTKMTILLCILSLMALCLSLVACGVNKMYSVTIADYDETQGTVTIAPESEDGTYKKDTEITVTVTPNEGYALDTFKLSTENGNKTPNDEGKFVFKVQEDTTITVTFKSTVVPVESVTLDEDTLELEVGGRTEDASATLVATVKPDNATDKTVTWTSSDPTIATVEGGNVTALAVGETTITATAGGKSATCVVTVTQHAHVFGAWVDEVPATCVKAGTKGYKECSSCEKKFDNTDKEITELEIPIDANAHHLVDQVGEDGHWQECDNEGCDYKSAVTGHVFNGALVDKGETGHANKCSIGDCTYTGSVTEHSAKDTTYTREADKHYQLCECGAHVNEATHAAAEGAQWQKDPDNNQHYKECVCGQRVEVATHAAKDNVWQHDEQNTIHFKLCVCGEHVEEDTHFASGYEYDTGDMTTGKHYQVCEECLQQFNIGTHQKSAKPQGDTNGHHYSCTVCPFVGADEPHSDEPADGEWIVDTESSGAHRHYYICTECDAKVSKSAALHTDFSKPEGEFASCSKCGYTEKRGDHKLSYVADESGMHHAECQNSFVGCTYKTSSESCSTAVDSEGKSTITWTEATDDPASGHTGKCACGNDIALEAHDKDGVDGTCSKCGYSGEHVCEDKEENGYYDGVCDVCGKNFNNTWTFADGTIEKYNGSYAKVRIPEKIDGIAVTAFKGASQTDGCFVNNTMITDIIIPESISSLPTYGFFGCSNLSTVIILTQIDTLPQNLFAKCASLSWLVLPATLTSINNFAFGMLANQVTKVLEKVYFMGEQSAWETLVNGLGGQSKTLLSDKETLFFSNAATGSATEWHWKVDGAIPEAGPWGA